MTADDRRSANLGYLTWRTATCDPDRVAVIDLHDGSPRSYSYGMLDARLDRVAAMLQHCGLKSGERLLLSISNRVAFVECMYGAMRAGVVPVPLNTRQGAAVLHYIARDSGASGIIAEPAANEAALAIAEEAGLGLRIVLDGARAGWQPFEEVMLEGSGDFEPPALPSDALSFLAYTSGSTGRPKGVPLTHEGQLWWVRAATHYWPAGAAQRSLVAMPLYHKNAMAGAVKPRLYSGGSLVLMPRFEARAFLQAIQDYRCTHIGGVPTVYALLLQQQDLLRSLDLSSLQTVVVGSAAVHEELVRRMAEAFKVPVLQSYGLTEGGPVMLGPPIDGRPVPIDSVGAAWPEGEVKLVGLDGREDPTQGELWVRNPGVSPGYYNLPEVNRERYVDGWLRTGDLFTRSPEGFFYFQGRVDDMFNCGGENIYPKEVENLLLRHPAVVEACVVPLDHATKGQAPVAMVSVWPDAVVDERMLKQFCLENGPPYAHPRRVVVTDALPITGAGKIDRTAIIKAMAERFGMLQSG